MLGLRSVDYLRTHSGPVPMRYVLVPCSVYTPGFKPSTRHTRLDNCSTVWRVADIMHTRPLVSKFPEGKINGKGRNAPPLDFYQANSVYVGNFTCDMNTY